MSRFITSEDKTKVTDTKTGLVWSKKTVVRDVTASEAEAVAEALAAFQSAAWRLPSTDELLTIIDRSKSEPAIDTDAFPDTDSGWYWTNERLQGVYDQAWVVDFGYGRVNNSELSVGASVRLVFSE